MLLLLDDHFFLQGIQSLLLTQLLPLISFIESLTPEAKRIKSDLVSIKEWLSWSPGSAHKLSLHTDKLGTLLKILHDICHIWYLTVTIGWTSQAENLKLFISPRRNSQVTCKNLLSKRHSPLYWVHYCLLPLCWKAFSENTTAHQQHWANSAQKSPSNHLLVIGWQLPKRCVMLIVAFFNSIFHSN